MYPLFTWRQSQASYVAEKLKKQTQEINAPHKPKPKVQDTKKWAMRTKIEWNTSSMVEDSNGGEGVGWKKKVLNA